MKGFKNMAGKLHVRFAFDDEKMNRQGFKRKDIYYTIKTKFHEEGLNCVSENEILAFEDTGNDSDWGNMWSIILDLLECKWFTKSASLCEFIENGKKEDVLSQLPEYKRIMEIQ